MLDWLNDTQVAHNSLLPCAFAFGGALLGFLLVAGLLRLVAGRLQKAQGATGHPLRTLVIALLAATRRWLVLLLALAIAAGFLHTGTRVTAGLDHAVFALCGLQLALWANAVIRHWLRRKDDLAEESAVNPVFLNMLTWVAWILVWSTLLLAFLANVGVNITAFVASLGVGGIAVALALQNVLGDFFSSIAIGLDKPFEVGDFIAFGDDLGTVAHVGVKTTRIASLSGEQLVIAHLNLLKELIHNYSRMPQRRVVFGFRVPYATSTQDVQTIVAQTRTLIGEEPKVRFDHGHLTAFGDTGFDFEFVYYVLDPDFTLYRDIQQRVNFRIMELLEGLRVAFAVPVRHIRAWQVCRRWCSRVQPPDWQCPVGPLCRAWSSVVASGLAELGGRPALAEAGVASIWIGPWSPIRAQVPARHRKVRADLPRARGVLKHGGLHTQRAQLRYDECRGVCQQDDGGRAACTGRHFVTP